MPESRIGRPLKASALALLVACATGCEDPALDPVRPELGRVEHGGRALGGRALEVYTQNVYLGGDAGPILSIDFSDLPAVIAAANVFWGQVARSRAPDRMSAIVDEIAMRMPHLVGLQEVFRFAQLDARQQPVDVIDLLALIEGEIAARGLPYETAAVQEATSAALPLGFDPSVGITKWLGFTDRLVVLRRTDVGVSSVDKGTYAAIVPLGPLDVKRAWARVSVDHSGMPHHFVTTHLEIQALAPVQAAQANELLTAVIAGLEGITIVSGDLNSDAAAVPGEPSWTPTYGAFRDAGFADVWELAPRSRRLEGFTCCQDPGLLNDPSELDERIDFVLVRSSEGPIPGSGWRRGLYRADVVGDAPRDRIDGVLWPSDHAGVVAAFRTPRPRPERARGPEPD